MLDDIIEEFKRTSNATDTDLQQFKIRIDNIVEHMVMLQQNFEKFQYGTLADRKVFEYASNLTSQSMREELTENKIQIAAIKGELQLVEKLVATEKAETPKYFLTPSKEPSPKAFRREKPFKVSSPHMRFLNISLL